MNRLKTLLIGTTLLLTVGCAGFHSDPQFNSKGYQRSAKKDKKGDAVSDTTQGFWDRFFEDAKPAPEDEKPDD